ncbi:MAG: helix-turn-helix transcriptional regulator [Alphaproteobacteria bacterium]|nr:helix-turn-helix transcriptional regulator [Alphaproteobacteria bacterium]
MPHHIDVEVGNRVRTLRLLNGFTQSDLAKSIGVKFQQVQKYETGANRISCSRIWKIAAAFDIPVTDFFHNICADHDVGSSQKGLSLAAASENKELLELQRAFNKLDQSQRSAILNLVSEIAESKLEK